MHNTTATQSSIWLYICIGLFPPDINSWLFSFVQWLVRMGLLQLALACPELILVQTHMV